MKTSQLIILSLLIILCSTTCKKEDDMPCIEPNGNVGGHPLNELGLPFATTEGHNTMGCLINGEPWLALKENFSGDLVYHIPFSVGAESQGGGGSAQGRKDYDEFNEAINISTFPAIGTGLYPLLIEGSDFIDFTSSCGTHDLDTIFQNWISIEHIDYESEIVAGTFEMRLVNSDCDTLLITQGRFDLSSE